MPTFFLLSKFRKNEKNVENSHRRLSFGINQSGEMIRSKTRNNKYSSSFNLFPFNESNRNNVGRQKTKQEKKKLSSSFFWTFSHQRRHSLRIGIAFAIFFTASFNFITFVFSLCFFDKATTLVFAAEVNSKTNFSNPKWNWSKLKMKIKIRIVFSNFFFF